MQQRRQAALGGSPCLRTPAPAAAASSRSGGRQRQRGSGSTCTFTSTGRVGCRIATSELAEESSKLAGMGPGWDTVTVTCVCCEGAAVAQTGSVGVRGSVAMDEKRERLDLVI